MAQDGILGQLREFVDFICGCDATMVYIKALEILSDCNENLQRD